MEDFIKSKIIGEIELDNDKIIKDREGKNTIACSKQWYFR